MACDVLRNAVTFEPYETVIVESFPPIARPDAQTLILGSMPGVASLRAQRYYAHPRNAFWPLVHAVFDVPLPADYDERLALLLRERIALWDVLQACVRPGSLDSSIDTRTMVANDFATFFAHHRRIRRVFFNGSTAETAFRRTVLPTLPHAERLTLQRLPSTSPAHAGSSFERKLEAWKAIA